MSFFHEPPPLDCDVPPPLDEKLRENDFDLEEEETNFEDENFSELPELPTDFNVFSSVATDESSTYSHPPPELPELAPSPPPLKSADPEPVQNVTTTNCDVAEEKESSNNENDLQTSEIKEIVEVPEDTIPEEKTNKPEEVEQTTFNVVSSLDDDDIPPTITDVPELDDSPESEKKSDPKVDDFNDFVTSDPLAAFKTETFLGTNSEFDEFAGFTPGDIPEPIPELKLDDDEDDDDFNDFDFESAIPVNRHVEPVSVAVEASEVQFEADFSGFNAFSEEAEEDNSFDDFQDFKAVSFNESKPEQKPAVEDDDDDFGDFSDFTQAPETASTSTEALIFTKPENVNGILELMFPPTSSCSTEKQAETESDCGKIIKSDNFVNKFNDFDSTKALGYLYNNSKASQTLVKALGIDTRNILYGAQWGSSSLSSNMPRFAANLSSNPIEPLKPSTDSKSSILQPTKLATEPVPAAEFDWNSSGLTNPLDAHKSNYLLDLEHLRVAMANSDKINSSSSLNHATSSNDPSKTNQMTDIDDVLRQFDLLSSAPVVGTHNNRNSSQPKPQPHDVEPIIIQPPTASSSAPPVEDESTFNVVDQEVSQVFEAETKANADYKPELGSDPYQWSSGDSQHHIGHLASSNSIMVRERTIKLPETHIFTPVKGTSPISREVISREVSPSLDDPYFTPKGSVIVKEYHDIEYSLEPKKKLDFDNDFDDFQSAQPKSDPPSLVPINLLEPQKVEKPSSEIKWPEPGKVANDDLDFLDTPPAPTKVTAPMNNFSLPPPLINNIKKDQEFSKPVIGTSPSEENCDDDDFNDFQAAPVNAPKKVEMSNDPITLSPARLVSQQSSKKPSWIGPMDDDEISRIEAAFPKCRIEKKISQRAEEDDWSDFVTVPPPQHSTVTKLSNGDTEDWSEFVSVPPPISKIPSAKSSNAISSQFQSKPNFSAWNQPIAPKHQYVNHTTSFLTSEPSFVGQPFTSSNYPYVTDKMSRQAMNITDNFNHAFGHSDFTLGSGIQTNHNHQVQPPKPNGISTILPELDFAMPKHLINLPRGGSLDPGKK